MLTENEKDWEKLREMESSLKKIDDTLQELSRALKCAPKGVEKRLQKMSGQFERCKVILENGE